ncbi:MAG: ComF family protein [Acidobacteria bacterium]|nr:ComF family protein [Acidobacteriota bacterium]
MADLIADHARPPAPGWLIPIPTGAKRLKQRGYNQTAGIGRQLAQRGKMPLAEAALTRVRDTRTQTALTPKARLANVAGAFVARPAPGLAKSTLDSNVRMAILVDDVLTTGATLDAAAHALASAGWSSIGAVTFARALPYASRIAAQVHRAKRLFTN